ncbi:hypothetical protein Bbelb_035250 [Branchiostoma belcheri]|nr:hypothetical protein Bbelb_035250 [Branchiostoma belcheri]
MKTASNPPQSAQKTASKQPQSAQKSHTQPVKAEEVPQPVTASAEETRQPSSSAPRQRREPSLVSRANMAAAPSLLKLGDEFLTWAELDNFQETTHPELSKITSKKVTWMVLLMFVVPKGVFPSSTVCVGDKVTE